MNTLTPSQHWQNTRIRVQRDFIRNMTLWGAKAPVVSSPGIKEGAVQKRAIVVIPEKIPALTLPLTVFRYDLILNGNAILGVMKVQQHNIKHQRCLSRNVFP